MLNLSSITLQFLSQTSRDLNGSRYSKMDQVKFVEDSR